jgi:hypothetical protein
MRADIKLCNCAACNIELLGDSFANWYRSLTVEQRLKEDLPWPVAGRINDRPYCPRCLALKRRELAAGAIEALGEKLRNEYAVQQKLIKREDANE